MGVVWGGGARRAGVGFSLVFWLWFFVCFFFFWLAVSSSTRWAWNTLGTENPSQTVYLEGRAYWCFFSKIHVFLLPHAISILSCCFVCFRMTWIQNKLATFGAGESLISKCCKRTYLWGTTGSTLTSSELITSHSKADIANCLLVCPSSFHAIILFIFPTPTRLGGERFWCPWCWGVEVPERGRRAVSQCQIIRREKCF